ncbi:flagellar basal-body MS-ring/collar protein FliF [Indiicoccus explosivorum]|uniref:flagellar basal-body MS-ring/collar protein FliF n=1 Tax=Indiicoccus explosivorum TaxID=1917864 RepID=UPI000B4550B2|nr:flagellar basal-body MS-ring/collar protein FliF [Indiicoccus explosivorum]
MNERMSKTKDNFTRYWQSRTRMQKNTILGMLIGIVLLAAAITYFTTKTTLVPLYSDVAPAEIGRIKEALDAQGVVNEIAPGGTSILVPEELADGLLVQLAAEGFPESGIIDYSFFSENAGFGMTDNEFDVMKLAAMESELADLISEVEGVNGANVMISMPEASVFLDEPAGLSTASIVLNTAPGHKFTEQQITALYSLVSKSIPNLQEENIVITNQFFEYYDKESTIAGASVTNQMEIKQTIERDLQRQVQMMLGTMMGFDNVAVSVTTDIDFQSERREENLVTPVDEENMEGIAISTQRITETYSGTDAAGGVPGMDGTDNQTQYAAGTAGSGDYEKIEETINSEVNRIRKEIVESPYKIRDIGLQVMVEPPDPADIDSLPPEVLADIEQILETIVRTTIDKEAAGELTEERIDEKIAVSVHPFYGVAETPEPADEPVLPWWIFAAGGVLALIIAVLAIMVIRSRRAAEEEEIAELEAMTEQLKVEDISEEKETEASMRRKQLEKMAKEKPEDFAKLLRTWIAED